MIKIDQIKMPVDYDAKALESQVKKILKTNHCGEIRLLRKSLDARKKSDLHYVLNVAVTLAADEKEVLKRCKGKNCSLYTPKKYALPQGHYGRSHRPIVVGAGPAGLFAGLLLAEKGACPLILEGGKKVEERQKDVAAFFWQGVFSPQSNIQFGEGGAGTFSDGKLTTGTKDFRHGYILECFAEAGASEEILYMAKPHIGSDVLPLVVKNLRRRIQALGGTFVFETSLVDFHAPKGVLEAIEVAKDGKKEVLGADTLILATGHSARSIYEVLYDRGVAIAPKAFSLGVRCEHLQHDINMAQYGTDALGAADYKLAVHLPNERSAYTFCMCPGGVVVGAASEENTVVTNGMSIFARNGENANSALLVGVTPDDFPDKSPLGGMYWQREIEKRAYIAGGGGYAALCQRTEDFLLDRPSAGHGKVAPTYLPKVTYGSIGQVLPSVITESLRMALPLLGKGLAGFDDGDTLLTAAETRSSAPLRILRNENCESNIRGIFPCGEGAGYAGGIMSSAADGLRVAEKLFD